MHALKQHPAARARALERLAQLFHGRRGYLIARLEVGLDHTVAASGGIAVAARGEHAGNVGRGAAVRRDADAMRVFVGMLGDLGINVRQRIERRHGVCHTLAREPVGQEPRVAGAPISRDATALSAHHTGAAGMRQARGRESTQSQRANDDECDLPARHVTTVMRLRLRFQLPNLGPCHPPDPPAP